MDLILWRHAEAHPADPLQPDADDLARALTRKGRRQAERMGRWLQRELPESTRVLVSPAVRTQQTAEGLERRFKTVDAIAPDQGVEALLAAVRWPDAREPVLVVGHQPTLGLAAAYLLTGEVHPWRIKRGSIWWLKHRLREDGADVSIHLVLPAERA